MNAIKKMKHIGLAAAILVSGFVASANAAAPEHSTYQFRGFGAYGEVYSYDACSVSAAYVSANQSTSHTDGAGKPVTSDYGYVYWNSFNWCSFSWSGGYAYGDLSVSGNGKTLKASGQMDGYDYNVGAVTVSVDVSFDATGDYFSRGQSSYSFSSPWGWGHSRYAGTSADAALSGSIEIGGTDLLGIDSSSYASVYTANSGSVTLYHP